MLQHYRLMEALERISAKITRAEYVNLIINKTQSKLWKKIDNSSKSP